MQRSSQFLLTAFCAASFSVVSAGHASAQAMASAISVTFGDGGGISLDGGNLSASRVTSMSMASSQGTYAAAGASAGGGITSALSGASMEGGVPPVLRLRANTAVTGSPYETELFFGDATARPSYEQDLLAPGR